MVEITNFPETKPVNGICDIKVQSWTEFDEVVKKLLNLPSYIYRGQRRSDWLLETTLNRILKKNVEYRWRRETHLYNFKLSLRGRRGPNPPEIKDEDENVWWALGQHNGLFTPLLDWTASPYVALFFAFIKSAPEDETDTRVVFALHTKKVSEICSVIHEKDRSSPIEIEFVEPMSDENPRLVNQAGLFTRIPDDMDLETWVASHYKDEPEIVLAKIHIPNRDRESCLKTLNKMNINYSTLFPDRSGSCAYTNMKLEIARY